MKKMNLQKILAFGSATLACTAALSLTAFAGNWVNDTKGWWYDFGNGSWPSSSWQWIDGNNDGVAECYYFDRFGYCILNGTTPDGYQVNENGAWVDNGALQTKNTGVSQSSTQQANGQNSNINLGGKKNSTKKAAAKKNVEGNEVEEDNGQQGNSNGKTSVLKLYGKEPIISRCNTLTELISNREKKTFRHGFGFRDGRFIEFDNSGNYTRFKATVFPLKGDWDTARVMRLKVFDDENELFSSDEIQYDTKAFEVDVDISGSDKIRISGAADEFDFFTSSEIGIVNARFE